MPLPKKNQWDPKVRRHLLAHLRAWVVLPICALWCFLWLFPMIIVAILLPKVWQRWMGGMARAWGKVPMFLCGVKLTETNRHFRDAEGPKILLFNHVNLFDLFVLSSTWEPGTSVVFKKEFLSVPLMGKVMISLGMLAIDRSNRTAAVKSLRELSRRVKEENRAVLIAPEGTRSKNGKLQSFKKGAFHLALQTHAPLVPTITQGLEQVMPAGSLVAYAGHLRLIYLAPTKTESWNAQNLEEHIEEMRRQFLEWLPEA
jgi:putative phosphoserine phosphatase/1-acylglycerol-3-phosphate O-acyltransferase